MKPTRFCSALLFLCFSAFWSSQAYAAETEGDWKPLFNGTNLDGWRVVIGSTGRPDTNHWVQVHDGMVHMYKEHAPGSQQPAGYIITTKDYSNYHLKLEYKWGQKRFGGRSNARRDAGILYHVVGKDGVWPRSVECQIQENDVGDVFTVYTRLTAQADPATTNIITEVTTNDVGVMRTNKHVMPVFKPLDRGGIPFLQGVNEGIRRVIRSPMAEREGWNTVEVIVHGDEATYIVNGKVNNHVTGIQQKIGNEWVALRKGKIALQLEYAEVFYRNVQIKEEPETKVE